MMLHVIASAQDNSLAFEDNDNIKQIIADFEREIIGNVARDTTGSFSASLFKGDRIIWSKAFGKMNNQTGLLADTNTIYRIGSISKTITAYLLMLLVQTGKINLDDPVIKYLPELTKINKNGRDEGDYITFRQLADHTSGLAREPDDLINNATGAIEEWENKVLSAIPVTTLSVPIGKSFAYSNIGYAILGLAISRAAQKPFIDLVKEMVFRPHDMLNSFYIINQDIKIKIATGYHWNQSAKVYGTEASEREFAGRGYKVPNGGIFTTANDLARFAIALTADTDVLAKNYRDSMQITQTFINKKKGEGYGLGLFITEDKSGDKKVRHDGAVAGYNSLMILDPESRIGVILLSNCDNTLSVLNREGNILLNKLVKANKKK